MQIRAETVRAPVLAQIAMCTSDMPRTIRRFIDVFRFADGRGDLLWGPWLAQLQDLGQPDTTATIWWLCSRQTLFQLEFFQHTDPVPRPQGEAWTPADLGWSRFGIAVPDFDATLLRLDAHGIETFTEPSTIAGVRRVAYQDPDIGCIIEVLEEGPELPGGVRDRFFDVEPAIVYVAASVTSLDTTKALFTGCANLPEVGADLLHADGDDALWGLPDATADRAVLQAGTIFIELNQYRAPVPRHTDRLISDLGLSHVAVGYRERKHLLSLADALGDAGFRFTRELSEGTNSTYIFGPDRLPLELLALPQDRDPQVGFAPGRSPLRPA
jgi:hypothetical protein